MASQLVARNWFIGLMGNFAAPILTNLSSREPQFNLLQSRFTPNGDTIDFALVTCGDQGIPKDWSDQQHQDLGMADRKSRWPQMSPNTEGVTSNYSDGRLTI